MKRTIIVMLTLTLMSCSSDVNNTSEEAIDGYELLESLGVVSGGGGKILPVYAETACNDGRIQGRIKPTVRGSHSGCGIKNPVVVLAIAGVKFSKETVLNCTTAKRLANWIDKTAKPQARKILNAELKKITPYASYSCRGVNNNPGARLSEHASGNAIDIGEFYFSKGGTATVLKHWNSGKKGSYLKRIWRGACGNFRTVLGPNADRYHRDHFHFDIARRTRAYCR